MTTSTSTSIGEGTRVLVVEDSDAKYQAIEVELLLSLPIPTVCRASTMTEAEAKICGETWDLVILDISMDIASSHSGPKRGGHATLGGMQIAQKMFLLQRDFNTIIVTAFDSFQSAHPTYGTSEMLGLEDIQRRAGEILGEKLLGCVRYGDPNWAKKFRSTLEGVSK